MKRTQQNLGASSLYSESSNYSGDIRINTENRQPAELDGYLRRVQDSLREFVLNPDFDSDIRQIFGTNTDLARAKRIIQDFALPDSNSLPAIEIRPGADINHAQGAYAAATDTVYLSAEFLRDNADNFAAITAVLLEEFGHALDARLNATDAPGDEGELFSALVSGLPMGKAEVQQIGA